MCGQLMSYLLTELFHIPSLLQCQRTVAWLALSSLAPSRGTVRGSALTPAPSWSLSAPRPAALSFAEPGEPPHCTLMNSSCVRCIVELVSCLCGFMTPFELEQEFRFAFCLASFKIHIKQTNKKIHIKQTASNVISKNVKQEMCI